jgi:hypothetical protein
MIVSEVIAELQKMPPDYDVQTTDGDIELDTTFSIFRVLRDPHEKRVVLIMGYEIGDIEKPTKSQNRVQE